MKRIERNREISCAFSISHISQQPPRVIVAFESMRIRGRREAMPEFDPDDQMYG